MLKSTIDYTMFKKHPSNRPIEPYNLKKIKESLQSKNLLEYRPLLVNSKYQIIDGQHRFEAAKELKLKIFYQVQEEDADMDMYICNETQKKWTLTDFVHFYSSQGFIEYQKLQNFLSETKLDICSGILMLGQIVGTKCHFIQKLKQGKYVFKGYENYEKNIGMINDLKDLLKPRIIGNRSFIDSVRFRRAALNYFATKDFKFERFMKNCERKIEWFRPCTSYDQYMVIFREVDNFLKRNKPEEITT